MSAIIRNMNRGEFKRQKSFFSLEDFDREATNAIDKIKDEGEALTLSNICFRLGLESVDSLDELLKKSPAWRIAINRIKLYVQTYVDNLIVNESSKNTSGAFKYAQAQLGYSEKSTVNVNEHKIRTIVRPPKKRVGDPLGFVEKEKEATKKKEESKDYHKLNCMRKEAIKNKRR